MHEGRLTARPGAAVRTAPPAGTTQIGGDAMLHVPPAAASGTPCALAVLFHGAGSSARAGFSLLAPYADAAGLVLVAPQSRGRTWDVIRGGFGPDVEALDAMLAQVFATVPVDRRRVAMGGFSDGASYALSLGIGNGDLATHIIAFSPGFMAPAGQIGRPRILVSHGVQDAVLPIERCSRRLVPVLERAGYDVDYVEFDGGHVVPADIAERAGAWLAAASPARAGRARPG